MAKKKKIKRKPKPKSKKGRKKTRPLRSGPSEEKLDFIEYLMDQGSFSRALEEVLSLRKRFPKVPALARLAVVAAQRTRDQRETLKAAESWYALEPEEPEAAWAMALAYTFSNYLTLGLDFLERYDQDGKPMTQTLKDLKRDMQKSWPEALSQTPLAEREDTKELAMLHETSQLALHRNEIEQVIQLTEQLIERVPNWPPPYNNRSLAQFLRGDLDAAITTCKQVLAHCEADNLHALSNLIRYLALQGRREEAKEYVPSLLRASSDLPDLWLKKVEALSFLGADEELLKLYEQLPQGEHLKTLMEPQRILHMFGVAAARLGHDQMAKKLFRQAVGLSEGFQISALNIADLKKPPGQREGAWAFAEGYWLPPSVQEPLLDAIKKMGKSRNKNLIESTRQFARNYVQEHPILLQAMPLLFERGAPDDRSLFLTLAQFLKTEETLQLLKDFCLGPQGTDQERHSISQFLTDEGLLPRNQMLPMWSGGKQTEILLFSIDITTEPLNSPRPLQLLLEEALGAFHEEDLERAAYALHQANERYPENTAVLQNMAALYERQGEHDKSIALTKKAVEIDPNYELGRCQLALHALIREGDIDAAEEWLAPVLQSERLHISAFRAFCQAQILLAAAKEQPTAVQSWTEIWREVLSEEPIIPSPWGDENSRL